MKTSIYPRHPVLLVAICFSLASVWCGVAAGPSGMYSYPTFTTPKLWDIAGPYHVRQDIDTGGSGSIDLEFDINIAQDAKGKLSGTGSTTVTIGTDMVTGTYTVKGSVKTLNGVGVVSATVSVRGTGTIEGAPRSYSASIKYALVIDASTKMLVGHAKGKASASGLGSAPIDEDIAFPVPAGMDGSWTLALDIMPTGTKLDGTASITLSNGRMLPFDLNGSYSGTTDMSKIKLKGTVNGADDATGSKLGLLTGGSAAVLDAVAGKVLGQSFTF
ncbi:MAG: hypothetical protein HY298_26570 [Verrucomicrobia bacterium]|nr:hypothetical protein [Verrucomicrobiota bacterium]